MNNKKLNKVLFIALPAAVIAGTIVFFAIANKNIPEYKDTENAKNRIKESEKEYISLRDYKLQKFIQDAEQSPDVIAFQKALEATQNDTTKAQLSNKIENLKDSLISEAINNDKALNHISKKTLALYELKNSLNENNEKRAEMLKVPALKRFNKNWAEIKNDFRQFYLEKQR